MREIPGWLIFAGFAAFLLFMMYSVNSAADSNCHRMFSMAHNERDSLDVVMRSDVYGGSHCRIAGKP